MFHLNPISIQVLNNYSSLVLLENLRNLTRAELITWELEQANAVMCKYIHLK